MLPSFGGLRVRVPVAIGCHAGLLRWLGVGWGRESNPFISITPLAFLSLRSANAQVGDDLEDL